MRRRAYWFAGVLLPGILKGVMLAAVVSMLLMIRRAAHAHAAVLCRIPGTRSFSGMARNPDSETVPGVLAFRVLAALVYFNVEHLRDCVRLAVRSAAVPRRRTPCSKRMSRLWQTNSSRGKATRGPPKSPT